MARFTFNRANQKKIALIPIWIIAAPLAKVMPRQSNLWVFGRKMGFGDGPGDFMRYVAANAPQIRCVWLSSDKSALKQARSEGYRAEYLYSIRGVWAAFRAGTSIVSFGLGDLNRPAAMSSRVIQLWHGSPLKRIGFDAEYIQYSLSSGFLGRILSRLLSVLAAWSYKQYSVIVAPHERVASRYQTAFRVPLDRILVTGDPRCDRLVGAPEQQMALKRVELYRYWGLSDSIGNTERIILYAPTWRDGKNWQPGPPPEVSLALQDMLAQTNARLIIRAHPCDGDLENALDGDSTRLHYIPAGKFPNINEWLVAFDVLISDYSGIAMDWTILGRPLLLFPYDLSQYESERGLYESYREFAGQEWCSSWMELIDSLRSLILDGDQRGNRISKHILNRYQAYSDGQNCHRLLAALTDNV